MFDGIEEILKVLMNVVITTVIFLIIYAIAKFILKKQLDKLDATIKNYNRKVTANKLLQSSLKYVVVLLYFIVILVVLGVPVTTIVTSAGLFSIALGFGAKSLVEDFITGFFIFFEKQYDVGDTVEINDFKGIVISLGFKSTVLQNWLGDIFVIRNGMIDNVINYSQENSVAVVELKVVEETNLEKVELLVNDKLNEMINRSDLFIGNVEYKGVSNISLNGITIVLTALVYPMKNIEAERVIRKKILQLFVENNIVLSKPLIEIKGE